MNTFLSILWLVSNLVMVFFIFQTIREKNNEVKRRKRKRWQVCLVIACVSFVAFGVLNNSFGSKDDEKETSSSIEKEDDEKTVDKNDESSNSEEIEDANESFELVAGELGEYGKRISLSEGTDMEEDIIVYYVPEGTYEVKNLGEYRTQVSVYGGYTKNNETGYDEYTETGSVVVLNPDSTDTIEVPNGWFIEIAEPTHISLTTK